MNRRALAFIIILLLITGLLIWAVESVSNEVPLVSDSFKKDFPIIGYERQHINKKWLDE